MIHQFDHRFATYQPDGTIRDTTLEEHQDPSFEPMPRYWVAESVVEDRLVKRDRDGRIKWLWRQEWLLGLRKTARSTDSRTAIMSLLPVTAVNDKLPLLMPESQDVEHAMLMASLFTSLVMDFTLRQFLGGTDVGHFVLEQLAVPRPSDVPAGVRVEMVALARELQITDSRLAQCLDGEPFPWVLARRRSIRARLDALAFRLYGLKREEVEHVVGTFDVLERQEAMEDGRRTTRTDISTALDALEAEVRESHYRPYSRG